MDNLGAYLIHRIRQSRIYLLSSSVKGSFPLRYYLYYTTLLHQAQSFKCLKIKRFLCRKASFIVSLYLLILIVIFRFCFFNTDSLLIHLTCYSVSFKSKQQTDKVEVSRGVEKKTPNTYGMLGNLNCHIFAYLGLV